jgi:hypothetical protein
MTTASAAVVGAMYIAGEAVVGDAGAFHAVDPADGSALEPGFQFADDGCACGCHVVPPRLPSGLAPPMLSAGPDYQTDE